jgi:hypothetical protein
VTHVYPFKLSIQNPLIPTAPHEPLVEGCAAFVQHLIPLLIPLQCFGAFCPELFRIGYRFFINGVVVGRDRIFDNFFGWVIPLAGSWNKSLFSRYKGISSKKWQLLYNPNDYRKRGSNEQTAGNDHYFPDKQDGTGDGSTRFEDGEEVTG